MEFVFTCCLTNKSELVHKFKTPDQIVQILVSQDCKIVLTEHEKQEGIAFDFSVLNKFPWCGKSLSITKDGVKVYTKMRTRQLSSSAKETKAAFLSFEFLKETSIEMIRDHVKIDVSDECDDIVDIVVDPQDIIANFFESECAEHERVKKERFLLAEKYVIDLVKNSSVEIVKSSGFKCTSCEFVAKSKGGLTKHNKKCKPK